MYDIDHLSTLSFPYYMRLWYYINLIDDFILHKIQSISWYQSLVVLFAIFSIWSSHATKVVIVPSITFATSCASSIGSTDQVEQISDHDSGSNIVLVEGPPLPLNGHHPSSPRQLLNEQLARLWGHDGGLPANHLHFLTSTAAPALHDPLNPTAESEGRPSSVHHRTVVPSTPPPASGVICRFSQLCNVREVFGDCKWNIAVVRYFDMLFLFLLEGEEMGNYGTSGILCEGTRGNLRVLFIGSTCYQCI